MSNEEKEKNAEAEEQEVLEQAQDAPAEEKERKLPWKRNCLNGGIPPCALPRNMTITASAW